MAVYTLFGQQSPGTGLTSDPTAYTMGVQFSVSVPGATLTAIWFYSPATATVLPQTIALYQVSGTSLVHSESASWSGAAGSGWVRAAFSSPPSLSASTSYKACVLQNTSASFYTHVNNYWDTGAGQTGITNGPLSAPNNAGGDGGQDTFNSGATLTYPATSFNATNYWVDLEVTTGSLVAVPPLMPPGLSSPAAWQRPPYRRLLTTTTIAGSGGVILPKPSLAGQGAIIPPAALPASPLMPPGLRSPAAWQYPPYPRLGQTITIAGSGAVVLPKPSLAGSGAVAPPPVMRPPLMPPGYLSPAAWQQPAYPRLGQTITIAGSGGVILPKPSLAGSGAVSPPIARPPLMPPGYLSPAAWQAPPYPRLGQVVTIAGAGGVVLAKPSLSGSGLVTISGIARPPLLPPGLASPAAWQFPQLRRPGQLVTIAGSGGVTLPKPSLAGRSAPAATTPTGSWWGLDTVLKQSREEFQAYVSRPPMACPNDGEPLRNAPATKSGSGIELYCPYCGFRYPQDWVPPSRPWY